MKKVNFAVCVFVFVWVIPLLIQAQEEALALRAEGKLIIVMAVGVKSPTGGFSPWWRPYSEVDLLENREVVEALELSTVARQKVINAYKQFCDHLEKLRESQEITPKYGMAEEAAQQFQKYRNEVLDLLDKKQQQKIVALDRLIYFRKFGIARYLKHAGQLDKSERRFAEIQEEQLKIWQAAFDSGQKIWRDSIEDLVEVLPVDIQDFLNRSADYFSSPFASDVTLLFLKDRKQLEAILNGKRNGERFRYLIETQGRFEMAFDGQVEFSPLYADRLFPERFYGYIELFVNSSERSGIDIELTAVQQEVLKEMLDEFVEKRRELGARMREAGDTDRDYAFFEFEISRYGEEWYRKVWNEVLLPHQTEAIVDQLEVFMKTSTGLAYLLESALLEEETRQQVEEVLNKYQKELAKIELAAEQDCLRLCNVHADLDVEVLRKTDRPEFLRPSLALMYLKSKKSK